METNRQKQYSAVASIIEDHLTPDHLKIHGKQLTEFLLKNKLVRLDIFPDRFAAMIRLVLSGSFDPDQDFREKINLEQIRAINLEKADEMKKLLVMSYQTDFSQFLKKS